jgi:hypothetical protein
MSYLSVYSSKKAFKSSLKNNSILMHTLKHKSTHRESTKYKGLSLLDRKIFSIRENLLKEINLNDFKKYY